MKTKGIGYIGIIILFILISFNKIFSQDSLHITWGEIPIEDLKMQTFPADTSASAVILFDFGNSYMDSDLNLVYERITRVKILNAKGFDYGTFSIPLYVRDHSESLDEDDIKGTTYWINEEGKIEKKELEEDDILKEEVDDDHVVYKFTLPALKPGCVIEARYKTKDKASWEANDWVFQRRDPVAWSEYRFSYPKHFSYAISQNGYEPYFISDVKDITRRFYGKAESMLGKSSVDCRELRWVVKDIPAFRDEPYITTPKDYINRIEIQLAGYALNYLGKREFFTNWHKLVDDLIKSDKFIERIEVTGDVKKITNEVTKDLKTPIQKVEAIYNWVAKSIVCSGSGIGVANQDVDDVLESKKGNHSEVTFLFLSMLKSIGIDGYAVISSTRSNGLIQDIYPMVSQFNYVLALAPVDNRYCFFDPTDPLRPMDLLPSDILNAPGLVIIPDSVIWVGIKSDNKNLTTSLCNLNLNEEGELKGNFEQMTNNYSSLKVRKMIESETDKDAAKEIFDTEKLGFSVDSAIIKGKDSVAAKLDVNANVFSDSYTQSNGEMIYLNPHFLNRISDNPFKAKTRRFPISYNYPRSVITIVNLTIPDNYEVKENLTSKNFSVSDFVLFMRSVAVQGNSIQIFYKFTIMKDEIPAEDYEKLKEFYTKMVSAEAEQLVLGIKTDNPVKEDSSDKGSSAIPQTSKQNIEKNGAK